MAMFEDGFGAPVRREEKPEPKRGAFSVFDDALRSHFHSQRVAADMTKGIEESRARRQQENRRSWFVE